VSCCARAGAAKAPATASAAHDLRLMTCMSSLLRFVLWVPRQNE
jgi:hypothetical protein